MLHDGILRLAPQRTRAWGPGKGCMRSLNPTGEAPLAAKPLKREPKHPRFYHIQVTATSGASVAEGSGDGPRASVPTREG